MAAAGQIGPPSARLCHVGVVFRLLGLLGGLSLASDLGTGAPLEESLRRCVVATRLARSVGCTDREVSDVLYTSLLQHLGCTAYSHESARIWGDDVASTRLAFLTDFSDTKDVWRTWVRGLAEVTDTSRARVLATTLRAGKKVEAEGPPATCEVARDASRRLGLPEPVQTGLFHALAMWNGKGHPATAGSEIPLCARVLHVASTAVLFLHHAGPEAASAQVRRRSGSYLDPDLADAFGAGAPALLDGIDVLDPYELVLDAEPDPVRLVDEEAMEKVARTFGDLVDLKSPSLHGHSAGVGDVASAAATELRLDEHARRVRIAGFLHDVGRVGVSSRIWDKAAPLTGAERDQARLHPYHSERILSRVPALAETARLAGQHHERCDGSGYHRGAAAAQQTMPSRVLAAADAYRTLVEGRPHHPAVSTDEACERLGAHARAGRLDADAVAAVQNSVGLRRIRRPPRPAELTERQVDVIRLLASGASNPEIAKRLSISGRTAEHHVQDVYAKIGTSTRAGAALFAMEHGLLDRPG